ncbi:hypothetical protein E2562_036951, partial [Oryza meyeriana var. granulata]
MASSARRSVRPSRWSSGRGAPAGEGPSTTTASSAPHSVRPLRWSRGRGAPAGEGPSTTTASSARRP